MLRRQMYINGQWCEGNSYYDLKSPFNNEKIAEIPLATSEQVDEAIFSAYTNAEIIANIPAHERSAILERASNIFERRLEECAQTMAKENAKPLKAARAEVARAIQTYKFAAEEAKRIYGETIPMDAAKGAENHFGFTIREPLGVIAAITPFNFPFNLVAHKLGPAFAAGNSVVLKPANQTPLSALLTAEIFEEAGLPPGVLNVVTGRGSEIGDVLIQDPRVRMVTFTGSLAVGLDIRKKAGLKKVTLELGSNSPVIVDSAHDLSAVAARCVEGAFSYAGQICISVQRIYVQKDLYHDFLEHFIRYTKQLALGDPLLPETDVSAMINPQEVKRIEKWIVEAKKQGAKIVCGGQSKDNILEPTILTDVSPMVALCCDEAFAPVVAVNSYNSWDEAIEAVNDSPYGLQAGVFTNSVQKAFAALNRIKTGGVIINDIPTFRVDHMPYGGVKNSGMGREGVKYSVEEMTELKFASFKLN